MPKLHQPKQPIPAPLRGAEIDTFTHHSVAVRLPDIARRVLAENSFPPDVVSELELLFADIPHGRIHPLSDATAPDAADWTGYTAVHINDTWLTVPWFFAETYFYRRILAITGYFDKGEMAGLDPYAYQKRQGLTTNLSAIRRLAARLETWLALGWQEATFHQLLAIDLWGNQADLSLWPAGQTNQQIHQTQTDTDAFILADERTAVLAHLAAPTIPRLDIILDNAGFEFVADLCLADYLLAVGKTAVIHLHAKLHPTFVSDVIPADVGLTLAFLQQDESKPVQNLGRRLAGYLADGRLRIHQHPFWTSPLPGWKMPAGLRQQLAGSHLLISKGDANYRRWLGDRHWPFTTSFADITAYFPAPLLALRTSKSEIAAGLTAVQLTRLDQKDPNWLIDGRWGLIQFSND
ncbi:MAG: damage-control phosphatase ARMT1 family protein [Anaerolineae bacterium]